jgi:hypothetical protein
MFQTIPIVAYAVLAFLIFVFAIVGMTDGSSKFANGQSMPMMYLLSRVPPYKERHN